MEIVTVMVCLIAWIAIAMAMVFPIARTAARTTPAATNSKRQHRAMLTLFYRTHFHKDAAMNIHLGLAPLVSLIAGILILIMPRLLNYIVALYLIVIGLIGLFGAGNFHF
jgi:hypothetical protein